MYKSKFVINTNNMFPSAVYSLVITDADRRSSRSFSPCYPQGHYSGQTALSEPVLTGQLLFIAMRHSRNGIAIYTFSSGSSRWFQIGGKLASVPGFDRVRTQIQQTRLGFGTARAPNFPTLSKNTKPRDRLHRFPKKLVTQYQF